MLEMKITEYGRVLIARISNLSKKMSFPRKSMKWKDFLSRCEGDVGASSWSYSPQNSITGTAGDGGNLFPSCFSLGQSLLSPQLVEQSGHMQKLPLIWERCLSRCRGRLLAGEETNIWICVRWLPPLACPIPDGESPAEKSAMAGLVSFRAFRTQKWLLGRGTMCEMVKIPLAKLSCLAHGPRKPMDQVSSYASTRVGRRKGRKAAFSPKTREWYRSSHEPLLWEWTHFVLLHVFLKSSYCLPWWHHLPRSWADWMVMCIHL